MFDTRWRILGEEDFIFKEKREKNIYIFKYVQLFPIFNRDFYYNFGRICPCPLDLYYYFS